MARVVIFETALTNYAKKQLREEVIRPAIMRALAQAQSSAPRDTGAYANSFQIVLLSWVGILKNVDPAAKFIEFGTKDTPRFRVLGRVVDSLKI